MFILLSCTRYEFLEHENYIVKYNVMIKGHVFDKKPNSQTRDTLFGSELDSKNLDLYARYLTRYVEEYKKLGIPISYLTPQNEPLHRANGYPTMGPVQDFYVLFCVIYFAEQRLAKPSLQASTVFVSSTNKA